MKGVGVSKMLYFHIATHKYQNEANVRRSVKQKGAILANAWASGAVVLLSVRKRGK